MMATEEQSGPPPLTYMALFAKFLRFGFLAFGGPVAQIAMIRQSLIDEEKWVSPARFNRLLAVMQILPGPEAHELCVHLGITARGRVGGLLAGLGFMLPGFLLMLALGWAYESFIIGRAGTGAVLLSIQIAVLAIIARAIHRIGSHIIENWLLAALAALSFVATLASIPFWIPLCAAGLLYTYPRRPIIVAIIIAIAAALAIALHGAVSFSNPFGAGNSTAPLVAGSAASGLALFVAGLKGGLLTFGGAYTAIPYVRADTVGRGWVSDASFLDGVALAGILPAPLVIFATFVGYVAGGWIGAFAITAGMFLPAFGFSMVFYERLEAIVENPALHRFLCGVAAAVVGVIIATLVQLGWSVGGRVTQAPVALAIFALSLLAVWRLKGKWVTPAIIAVAGLIGWIVHP